MHDGDVVGVVLGPSFPILPSLSSLPYPPFPILPSLSFLPYLPTLPYPPPYGVRVVRELGGDLRHGAARQVTSLVNLPRL